MNAHITLNSQLKTDGIYINTSVGDALDYLIWFLENHKLTTVAGEDRRKMAIAVAKGIMEGIRDGVDPEGIENE